MKKVYRGYIPERITIICRQPEHIVSTWEVTDEVLADVKVTPAFVTEAGNKGRIETGTAWAKGRAYRPVTPGKVISDIPNKPCTVQIVGLELRQEGGRAYKAIFGNDYLVDLREDVLLEALMKSGCDQDGTLEGEFVWAIVGNHTKLVRVDSALYHALVANTDRKKVMKAIPASQLEIGGIYRQPGGGQMVYLGLMETTEIVDITENEGRGYRGYGVPPYVPTWRTKFWKGQVWFNVAADEDVQKAFGVDPSYFQVNFYTSTPKVVEKLGKVKHVPAKPWEWARATAEKGVRRNDAYIAQLRSPAYGTAISAKEAKERRESNLRSQAKRLNLGPVGAGYINPLVADLMPTQPA